MIQAYRGSVFGIRELTEEQRQRVRQELADLERDLVRHRKRLAYWSLRKMQAETLPDMPDKLRESAFHFHGRALALVASGERLRAYLIAELIEQPEHQAAYYLAH